jgi:hypothetical protein
LPGIERVVAVATEPAALAAAVLELLTDSELRQQRSEAQMDYARGRFSAAAQMQSLLSALALIGLRPDQGSLPEDWVEQPAEGCVSHLAMA